MLDAYLQEKGVWHRFTEKQETVHTADAAAASGVDLKRLTKSLVLLDEEKRCLLAILPGDKKLSFGRLCAALGVKKAFLVPFSQAQRYSGYEPGATPMVHHAVPMRVAIDRSLTAFETIFGGGGTRTRILELRTEDVVRLNDAVVADITE